MDRPKVMAKITVPTKIVPMVRMLVQTGSAGGLTYLYFRQDYARVSRPIFAWLGWLDPLAGLAGYVRGRWPVLLVLSLASLGLAIWQRRLFCGWLCPVGLVLDLSAKVKRILRMPDRYPVGILEAIRWIVFGAVCGLVMIGRSFALAFEPLVLWPRELARLSDGLWPWSLILLVVLGLLTFPRFWCRFLCPAGSALGLAARFRRPPRAPGSACRRCGLCISACPMGNIGQRIRVGRDCLNCSRCVRVCPVDCLSAKTGRTPTTDSARREFLLAAGGGLGAFLAGTVLPSGALTTAVTRRWPRLLRPPGALTEMGLAATCSRCGQCAQVCPSKCVVQAGLAAGLAGFGTPRFIPRRGQCMFCMACGKVCPTGSLASVPVETARLGSARIDREKCLAWKQGTECLLCVETCPTFALEIKDGRPVIDSGRCTGCGACEAKCPVPGSAAILTYEGEVRRRS